MAEPADGRKTVIITGASRGVGLATALRLAAAGFRIVAVARSQGESLSKASEALAARAGAGEIVFRGFDLSQVEDIGAFVRDLRGEFGAPFGLVNNAAAGDSGLLANMHLSQIEAMIRLTTLSPIVLTKYVARAMMAAGGGRIVNVSSIIASTGYNGLSVYGATKASLVGFTRSLARELGRLDITVNAVAPGFMATEMTKTLDDAERERVARRSALQRLVAPEDVAECVHYLMSDAGRNVTGSVLTIDAGATA
jgi:3-oxoacyl-[acyl-carrier protein] reductase